MNSYYDKKVLAPNKVVYSFENLNDYLRFTNDIEPTMSGNARTGWDMIKNGVSQSARRTSWFGTTDASSVIGKKNSFLFNNELSTFLQNLRNQTVNTNITDIDQQKKIEFTERDIGIFSFDLASLGLIRVYEYYSPLLKKIVNSDYIRSYETGSGDMIFYHIKVPYIPRHRVKFNKKEGGYFSTILNKLVPFVVLEVVVEEDEIMYFYPEEVEIPQHDVERVQKKNDDGGLKFATTFKKSFIYVPRVKSLLPRIDLIITSSYTGGVSADTEMIWNTMAALSIAEKLSASNVNYRIIAAFTDRTGGDKDVYSFVKIKDENQPLDINQMAILLSDGRFFRYETFLGSFATMFDAGFDQFIRPSSISETINGRVVKDTYMDYLKTKNSLSDQEASKNAKSKILFNQALSEQEAINEFNRVIREISII
jgi:hypothetical protein